MKGQHRPPINQGIAYIKVMENLWRITGLMVNIKSFDILIWKTKDIQGLLNQSIALPLNGCKLQRIQEINSNQGFEVCTPIVLHENCLSEHLSRSAEECSSQWTLKDDINKKQSWIPFSFKAFWSPQSRRQCKWNCHATSLIICILFLIKTKINEWMIYSFYITSSKKSSFPSAGVSYCFSCLPDSIVPWVFSQIIKILISVDK